MARHTPPPDRRGEEEQIEGRKPILEALAAASPLEKIWLAKGSTQLQILYDRAKERGIRVEWVDRARLEQRARSRNHQGAIAWLSQRRTVQLEYLFEIAHRRRETPFFIVAAEVQDPYNLGSLIRSAEAAGAHGLIIPERRSAGLTAAVTKASAGALEHLAVCRVKNLPRALEQLKKEGVWIVGTAPDANALCYDVDLTVPIAVVIGNEEKGMPQLVRRRCDFLVRLPMLGKVASLNAGTAGAIVFYEVVRQRLMTRQETSLD